MRIPRLSPPISKSHALSCDFEALYRTVIPRRSTALPRNSEAFYRAAVPTFAHIHPSFPSSLPSVLALFLGLSRFGQQHKFYDSCIVSRPQDLQPIPTARSSWQLKSLSESAETHRHSFVEQLESAFRTPAKYDLNGFDHFRLKEDVYPIPTNAILSSECCLLNESVIATQRNPQKITVDTIPSHLLLWLACSQ